MVTVIIVALVAIVASALIFYAIGYRKGTEHGTKIMALLYEAKLEKFLKADMPDEP